MRLSYKNMCYVIYIAAIFLLSFTNYQEQHPDEWYQTLDVTNLIVNGHSFSDTSYIHHRNLLIPMLLSIPFFLLKSMNVESPYLLFSFMKLWIGCLNLVVLWAMLRLWREEKPGHVFGEKLIYVVFCLTHISFFEAIRPSLEHFSSIMFWLMLGFWTLRHRQQAWVGVGFFAVLTGAARYPSGIMGFLFFIWHWIYLARKGQYTKLILLTTGCLLGLGAGFSADVFFYGRAYESLYMYLMYNVFTGLAAMNFGAQSALVYADYFLKIFQPSYIFFLPLFLYGALKGTFDTLKKYRSWSWVFVAAFSAHFLPLHKEGRFISSFLFIMIFLAIYSVEPYVKKLWRNTKVRIFIVSMFSLGGLHVVEHTFYQMRGGRFLLSQTVYLQDSCIVSYKWFPSFMFSNEVWENHHSNLGVLDARQKNVTWIIPKHIQCNQVQMIVGQDFFEEAKNYGCKLSARPWYQHHFLEDFLNVKSFECDESELRKNLSYRYDGDLVKSNSFILHKELPSLG
ncbi:MAG: hypothetical protein AB8C84_03540, partial [Oligoflexales bacterium]